jgi:hypothetical protein
VHRTYKHKVFSSSKPPSSGLLFNGHQIHSLRVNFQSFQVVALAALLVASEGFGRCVFQIFQESGAGDTPSLTRLLKARTAD